MDQTYDARTPSRPTNDRNRLHRSNSYFESIPGQRGLGTRQYGASVKSQSGHFGASDSSSPAVTIRPSCTLSVASKIVQLAIPSSPPIWPASSRSAQCSDLPSPAKTWSYAEEIVFSRVASAAAPSLFRLARPQES